MILQEALAVITKELVAGERTNDEKQFAEAVGTALTQAFTDLHSIAESLQVIAQKPVAFTPPVPLTFTAAPIQESFEIKLGGDS